MAHEMGDIFLAGICAARNGRKFRKKKSAAN
jgi:hypothetical protein